MIKKEIRKQLGSLIISLVTAAGVATVLDVISVLGGRALSVPKFALLMTMLFAFVHFIPFVRQKLRKPVLILLTSGAIVLVAGVFCWKTVSNGVIYTGADRGKTALYGGQSVLLLVPHQDDDINVLGGVIEEYVKYGSEVTVVFSTNGDYSGTEEIRFREAIDALGAMGVPEEQVIFLGYGDQWAPDGPHIYNGSPGEVITSYYGRRETYGTAVKGVYREGVPYTADHFLEDIECVILEFLPDVIYCVDYDYHIDHRALSLGFEKVMGRILKNEENYKPLVMKGYAYNSAWEAAPDFYAVNLLQTRDVYSEDYCSCPEVYHWEERIRLPINADNLSRSLLNAEAYAILKKYESQGAKNCGSRILNGDKVFWERSTDSVLYQAEVTASSGDAMLLTDYMLLETRDLCNAGDTPWDGVWIPEEDDAEKQVTVTFEGQTDIYSIVLYDHPADTDNVLEAEILFDDGTAVKTGPLDADGAATRIPVDKTGVSSFTVRLLEGEGQAGLTEIEAFAGESRELLQYVKIMDAEENFLYDYWIHPSGTQSFRLYTRGVEAQEYSLTLDNAGCSAVWQDGQILVTCPVGETCVLTVTAEDGSVSDGVCIRNPGSLQRAWIRFWLGLEQKIMELCETKRIHERIFVWRNAVKVLDMLG